ncbi:MAG: 4-(cytidine 5'-diphospho)-2-C-methyl-D-erythritol kinase [Candidatus Limnocylindrales bacterium]
MSGDAPRGLAPVVRFAPAKLNLTLAVLGRRPDGHHELHSIMVTLGFGDVLTLAVAPGGVDSLHVEGLDPGPSDDNLILRALAETRRAVGAGWAGGRDGPSGSAGAAAPPLAARLDKRIPVAAGLGGGSSDAAAAIVGAAEAWGAELVDPVRTEIAARLGSDVPFFLAAGAAIVEGRGERVSPVRGIVGRPPGILLVTPSMAISTAAVFAAFDGGAQPADRGATAASSTHLAGEVQRGLTAERLLDRAAVLASANDLATATAVVEPAIVGLRRALARLLGRPIGQSGSGPTLWALYPSAGDAVAGASLVDAALAAGTLPLVGPAPPTVVATTITVGQHDVHDTNAASDRGPEREGPA